MRNANDSAVHALVQYKYNHSNYISFRFDEKCELGEHIIFYCCHLKLIQTITSLHWKRDSNIDQQIMSIYCIANKKIFEKNSKMKKMPEFRAKKNYIIQC